MSRRARNIPSSTGTVRRLNETNILAQAKTLAHLHLPCFTALARLLLDSDLYFELAPGCVNIIFNCACSGKMIVECHNVCKNDGKQCKGNTKVWPTTDKDCEKHEAKLTPRNVADMVDIAVTNEGFKRQLIFTDTRNATSVKIYEEVINCLNE